MEPCRPYGNWSLLGYIISSLNTFEEYGMYRMVGEDVYSVDGSMHEL